MEAKVKDIGLADKGLKNIRWAEQEMKALLTIKEELEKEKTFEGIRIGMALHITKETAVLIKTFIAGGAEVSICSCNPLSTQDDVAAALAKDGVKVFGYKGETVEEYYEYLRNVIAFKPHITIDDGCDLISEIHNNFPELIENMIGGCEETTTGIIRLRAMEKDNALKYPIIAVNDNMTKHLMDNYYGTGQSTIDGLLRASNILFAGKTVVVSGYGSCGKGISMRAEGLGANVIVTEVSPFRALQAKMDGFRVMKIMEASKIGDIFITATGNKNVISWECIKEMKSGVILANSGHFNNEVDVAGMAENAKNITRVRDAIFDRYDFNGEKFVYLAGEGRLVNLACAEGHPSQVMSLSFCGQALAVKYCIENKDKLENKVITLPPEIDNRIALLQIQAMGVEIDELTDEQTKYLNSWSEGT